LQEVKENVIVVVYRKLRTSNSCHRESEFLQNVSEVFWDFSVHQVDVFEEPLDVSKTVGNEGP
jgi:hypothetical protein